ncbi:hypothetical protein D3C87_299770 [compost metagenome]
MSLRRRTVISAMSLGLLISGCESLMSLRSPASNDAKIFSVEEIIRGSELILQDLQNPNVFNPSTCVDYVHRITDSVFKKPSDYYMPKNETEKTELRTKGPQLLQRFFDSRLALRGNLQKFDGAGELTIPCVNAVREGLQYFRFAEEFLLEWLVQQKVYADKKTIILDNEAPYTMTNPAYANFKLKSGDVMNIRGKSYVSAMIARIGDEEGHFSHLAVVGEDKKGKLFIVESLIQYGVIVTPLEKWRKAEDARVALYRQPDEVLAKKSARAVYDYAMSAISKGTNIRYDFAMDDSDYSTMFCSEVGKYAYDKGSDGKFIIPKFRTQATKFKGTTYLKDLGVDRDDLFAPFDMEVDPRFDFVAEYRYLPLIRQVRLQDAVLQSVYEWMVKDKYEYSFTFPVTGKAFIAKLGRQMGLFSKDLPKYMPMDTLLTTLKFEAVATTLEKNIYAKEAAYFKKHGHSLTFVDMMAINNEYRRKDCELHKSFKAGMDSPFEDVRAEAMRKGDRSVFHWFFSNNATSCL